MEHFVPSGPLAVRWLACSVGEVRAGALAAARVELENAGLAAVARRRERVVPLARRAGQPDRLGRRCARPWSCLPGGSAELELRLRGPIPPGTYRLAFDLVDEGRLWFAEVGNHAPELEVEVLPRARRGRGRLAAARGRARARPGRARSRGPRGGLRRGRRLARDRRGPPGPRPARARTVRARRRPQPRVRAPARLPVPPARPRAERRGGRAARLAPRGRRAVALRRADHSSTASRSSRRLKTQAPRPSETTAATTR